MLTATSSCRHFWFSSQLKPKAYSYTSLNTDGLSRSFRRLGILAFRLAIGEKTVSIPISSKPPSNSSCVNSPMVLASMYQQMTNITTSSGLTPRSLQKEMIPSAIILSCCSSLYLRYSSCNASLGPALFFDPAPLFE